MHLVSLPPDTLDHLVHSLKTQWKRYRKKLRRCQKRFSADAVHESRVETRRLLSLVGLFAPFLAAGRFEKVERALKQHLDTFDDLRDTHVQDLLVRKMADGFDAAQVFHAYLRNREERLTKRTRKAIKRVKAGRLNKLIAACRQNVTARSRRARPQRASAAVLRAVDRAFARTRRLRDRILPDDTATIHRTRVAFKKFRYMVETLAHYLPGVDRRFRAELHGYQTMMGDIQDMEVLLQALDKYLQKKSRQPERARPFRDELLRRRLALVRAFLAEAARLECFWPAREPSPRVGRPAARQRLIRTP